MEKYIHISIDDVLGSLKYLTLYKKEIKSIWETRFYGKLQELHEKYNAIFSLYCFDEGRGFSIKDCTDKFKNDFLQANSWLRFGFHGRDIGIEFSVGNNIKEYIDAYTNFENFIKRNQLDNPLKVIRLHNFQAGKKQIDFLKSKGVRGFLTADDERACYGLSEQDLQQVRHSVVKKNDIFYIHTDIRLENFDNISDLYNILKYKFKIKNVVSVFTHEWCFDKNINKLEKVLMFCSNNMIVSVADEILKHV